MVCKRGSRSLCFVDPLTQVSPKSRLPWSRCFALGTRRWPTLARYYRSISSNTKFPKAFPETEAATQSHGPCALSIGPKTNTGRLFNGKLGQSMDQGAWPFPYGWYYLLIEFAVGLRCFVCLNRPFRFEFCPHSGPLTCLHFRGSDSGGGFNVCLPSRGSISSHHSLPCHSPWVPTPRVLQR